MPPAASPVAGAFQSILAFGLHAFRTGSVAPAHRRVAREEGPGFSAINDP